MKMSQRGFSLLELAVALAAAIVIMAVGLGTRKAMLQSSYARQTAREMVAIRDAGLLYYWKNGVFPSVFSDLSGYMPAKLVSAPTNPYGFAYTFTGSALRFQVSTTIPNSVAGDLGIDQVSRTTGVTNDTLTVSGVVDMGNTGGAIYEKDKGWSG